VVWVPLPRSTVEYPGALWIPTTLPEHIFVLQMGSGGSWLRGSAASLRPRRSSARAVVLYSVFLLSL